MVFGSAIMQLVTICACSGIDCLTSNIVSSTIILWWKNSAVFRGQFKSIKRITNAAIVDKNPVHKTNQKAQLNWGLSVPSEKRIVSGGSLMMVTPYVRQDRSISKPASNGKLGASQNFSCQIAGKSLRKWQLYQMVQFLYLQCSYTNL